MVDEQLEDWVAGRIARSVPDNDIIREICETRGMDWKEAESFVTQVRETHGKEISRRRTPILLIIGGVTVLVGALLLVSGGLTVWSYVRALRALELFTLSRLGGLVGANIPLFQQLIIGALMVIGGAWGMGKAIGDASSQA